MMKMNGCALSTNEDSIKKKNYDFILTMAIKFEFPLTYILYMNAH